MQLVAMLMDPPSSFVAWATILGLPVAVFAAYVAFRPRRPRFKPDVTACLDEAQRITVDIVNEASRPGTIKDVNLLGPKYEETNEVEHFRWERKGVETKKPLVPFLLPAEQSAAVVLLVGPDLDADEHKVRVDYARGDSGPVESDPPRLPSAALPPHASGTARVRPSCSAAS